MPFPAALMYADVEATERELAAVEDARARLVAKLAQPQVSGSWAEKLGWQLAALDRWVVRLRGMLA